MSRVFVDTNIFAYARDCREPVKQKLAVAWLAGLARQRNGRISWQVLTEFYAVATHPGKLAMATAAVRADIRALSVWNPIAPDILLFETAWSVCERYHLSWWDALIVAAALRQTCEILLSEDMQHGMTINGALTIINPFAPDAPDVPQ